MRWCGVFAAAAVCGCLSRAIGPDDGNASGASSDDGDDGPGIMTTPANTTAMSTSSTGGGTATTASSTATATATDGTDDSSNSGGCFDFICIPDGGFGGDCSTFAQDCPPDEKCTPWANDGGNTWNAVRCAPVAADPAQVGEPCMVEASPVSGVDNCEIGAMCWDVDPATLQGERIALCGGSENQPTCPGDGFCSQSGAGVLALCLGTCDPLAQDCDASDVCVGSPSGGAEFICLPDGSGGMGGQDQPCEAVNGCDAGFACIAANWVPGCNGTNGCCSAFCDTSDPSPPCPAGVPCEPWFEAGQAPMGFETVGVCAVAP